MESYKNQFEVYVRVLPISLQKNVIKWLEDKKIFWASQIDKN